MGSVLLLDDPEHQPERKVLQAPFTPRRVNALADGIRALADELLDPFEQTGMIEFVKRFSYPLSLGVIAQILGIPTERFGLLERGVEAAFLMRGGGLTQEEIVQACLVFADLYDYIAELVDERREAPGADYISIMIHTVFLSGSEPRRRTRSRLPLGCSKPGRAPRMRSCARRRRSPAVMRSSSVRRPAPRL